MTLGQILRGLDRNVWLISYRTIARFDGKELDIFTGECRWLGGHLFSMDGDIYSLDDEITSWNYDGECLTVYYESRWYSNGD